MGWATEAVSILWVLICKLILSQTHNSYLNFSLLIWQPSRRNPVLGLEIYLNNSISKISEPVLISSWTSLISLNENQILSCSASVCIKQIKITLCSCSVWGDATFYFSVCKWLWSYLGPCHFNLIILTFHFDVGAFWLLHFQLLKWLKEYVRKIFNLCSY